MPIRCERRQKNARYLDPRTDFQETTIACEMRRDPLTGRSGRVAHGLGFRIHSLDVAPLIAASQPSCPFCPDRLFEVTPRFPVDIFPEARLQRREAVPFPHLQVFATDTPGNTLEEELTCSLRYYREEGRSYWADLLLAEERLGERWVARGAHSAWLTNFVSQSLLADTLILFPEHQTIVDLSDEALDEFCRGFGQALGHLASQGVYSFNLAWFSGVAGSQEMCLHARLSPRLYLTPSLSATDTTALQHLYQEHFMVQTPEAAASSLQQAFKL